MLEELGAILAADFGPHPDARALAEILYRRCYIYSILDPERPRGDGRDLTAELIAANQSREGWDLGWRLEQGLEDGRVLARKGGSLRAFAPGQYITLGGPGARKEEGQPIRVFAPAGSADAQPGFYYAFGETIADFDEFEDLLRFYWNITAEGAPRLMAALTRQLNRFQLPFRFKIGRTEASCRRRDAAVLYVNRRYYRIAAQLVERVHAAVTGDLRDDVPLFTLRLARGLGFAEDPGGSFGKHRCAILADAITVSRDMEEVRRQFAVRGLSLDAPWLNSGSSFPAVAGPSAPPANRPAPSIDSYLEMAVRLGARLCRDALWCGGMCNWTGDRGGDPSTHGALESRLYTGTSGIALFLWRLFCATGEPVFRVTAEGALRQALFTLPLDGCAYYTGPLGILSVATEITGRCDHDGFRRARPDPARLDVIAGSAGAIATLLHHGFADLAVQHGDLLLAQARKLDRGWCWKTLAGIDAGPTGFAHGAAGIAWALIELFHATGEERFRRAALEGFRYEQTCFDAQGRTWLDLGDSRPAAAAVWCHGGGGIALARLRAWQVLGGDDLRKEACLALAIVADGLPDLDNYSLCHGIAGNADLMLAAGEMLADPRWTAIARNAADAGIERCESRRIPWPSGLHQGHETPDLMWGIAGIGYFYLRMSDPSLDSVLLPFASPFLSTIEL